MSKNILGGLAISDSVNAPIVAYVRNSSKNRSHCRLLTEISLKIAPIVAY
jgi:hypothetical protein